MKGSDELARRRIAEEERSARRKPTSREGELEARTRRISRFAYYLPFRLSWPFLPNPLPYGGGLVLNGTNEPRYQRNGS